MFIPNARAKWQKKAAKRSITGRPAFSSPRLIPLSVVSLKDGVVNSGVRADSTASRGAAEQIEAAAVFLVPPQYAVVIGDLLTIHGLTVQVSGIQPRGDVFGKLDHLEVSGDIFVEK